MSTSTLSNSDMKAWLESKGLPWDKSISQKVSGLGAECVEDLKLLSINSFLSLFGNGIKFVVCAKLKLAFDHLKKDKFDFLVNVTTYCNVVRAGNENCIFVSDDSVLKLEEMASTKQDQIDVLW